MGHGHDAGEWLFVSRIVHHKPVKER
jgi:hypothetical protein